MLRSRFLSILIGFLVASVTFLTLAPCLQAASKYRVLHSFGKGSDGAGVFSSPTLDAKGNLYGTTTGGGAHGHGSVFELKSSGGRKWTESVIYSFCSLPHCDDGSGWFVGVVIDAVGNLYGASNATTFQLTPGSDGWKFNIIHNTASYDLLRDATGNLYGAGGPGKYGFGDIFELSRTSKGWIEKALYSFCRRYGCPDGDDPQYRLTWDTTGNLYGVTRDGGPHRAGVAFQLEHTAGKWREHVLHGFPAFDGDGYNFHAGLTSDNSGNVYGTTLQGGTNETGTVFELSPQKDGHWKETILTDFPNSSRDGAGPSSGVVLDKAGNLYGTTTAGGDPACGCGGVFKLTRRSNGTWKYRVLHRFTGKDGWVPQATPILDDKGNLYGTTTEGGGYGYGVVFEITP